MNLYTKAHSNFPSASATVEWSGITVIHHSNVLKPEKKRPGPLSSEALDADM